MLQKWPPGYYLNIYFLVFFCIFNNNFLIKGQMLYIKPYIFFSDGTPGHNSKGLFILRIT